MSYHLMASEELHTLPDTDVLEHYDSQIDALDEVLAPDNSAAFDDAVVGDVFNDLAGR